MIKEAYCSYELSKLLREKGFDEECIGYYVEHDPKAIRYSFLQETNSTWEERCCSAPSHQLALAWLREVHNLFLDVGFGKDFEGNFLYMVDIYDLTNDAVDGVYRPIIEADDYLKNNPKTPEEAIESAIFYVLNNCL